MVILTREQRKKYFNRTMIIMEVDPEDIAHKLFMALTKNEIRSVLTILKMHMKCLKDLSAKDTEGNTSLLITGRLEKSYFFQTC